MLSLELSLAPASASEKLASLSLPSVSNWSCRTRTASNEASDPPRAEEKRVFRPVPPRLYPTAALPTAQIARPRARAGCFWLESRWGFPNRGDFDSTCWLGGGQQECRSRTHKTYVTG